MNNCTGIICFKEMRTVRTQSINAPHADGFYVFLL